MKKIWFVSLLLTLCTIVLAACGNEEGGTASSSGSEPVKVHIADQNTFALSVAHSQGFLKEELAKVNAEYEYSLHNGGPPINEGIASKRVEFGVIADGAILGGASKGLDTKLISLSSDGLRGVNTIIATEKSGIKKPEDLKGKKIAVAFGTANQVFLVKILDEVGLSIDDVTLINLSATDAQPAFQTNQVDAWATVEIYSHLEKENGAAVVATPEKLKLYSPVFYVARGEFAEQHPEIVEAFLKAVDRSLEMYKTDYDKFLSLVAEATSQEEQMIRAIDTKSYTNEAPSEELLEEFQKSVGVLKELGYLEKDVVVKDLLDLTYIDNVRGR